MLLMPPVQSMRNFSTSQLSMKVLAQGIQKGAFNLSLREQDIYIHTV
jgi:hypothetical protein